MSSERNPGIGRRAAGAASAAGNAIWGQLTESDFLAAAVDWRCVDTAVEA